MKKTQAKKSRAAVPLKYRSGQSPETVALYYSTHQANSRGGKSEVKNWMDHGTWQSSLTPVQYG